MSLEVFSKNATIPENSPFYTKVDTYGGKKDFSSLLSS